MGRVTETFSRMRGSTAVLAVILRVLHELFDPAKIANRGKLTEMVELVTVRVTFTP